MLTGARRDEIASLQWSEIDVDGALIVLAPARTKNRRVHEIPLTPAALEILRAQPRRTREFVFGSVGQGGFQGWSKSKAELDARLPLPEWRLHDLRRTVSTVMHDRLNVAPHIVEAILGHISGHKAGVAGAYNYAKYQQEKRRALALWADHLAKVVANV
jgi:integrase